MTALPGLILAAGFGTRMRPLTETQPKALIEVAGRPLIDHAIAAMAGASPICANAHHRAAQVRAYLRTAHPAIRVLHETPDILDSGGAVKNAARVLDAPELATVNADAVWSGPNPLAVAQAVWRSANCAALLLLVPRQRAHGRVGGGDVALARDGTLAWDRGAEALVYTGLQIVATDRFLDRPKDVFGMREVWEEMREAGQLRGAVYPGHWADVGHPEGIDQAARMLAR